MTSKQPPEHGAKSVARKRLPKPALEDVDPRCMDTPSAGTAGRAMAGSQSLTTGDVMRLQRVVGNEVVDQLLEPQTRNHPLIGRRAGTADLIQRGILFDAVKAEADKCMSPADPNQDPDYHFSTLSEKAVLAAAQEMIRETAANLGYVVGQGQPPEAEFYGGKYQLWGEKVRLPGWQSVAADIATGTFLSSLSHELGHWTMPAGIRHAPVRTKIEEMALTASEEATKPAYNQSQKPMENMRDCASIWQEELRADLTGVYHRLMRKEVPKVSDYRDIAGEDAERGHPPGQFRVAKIQQFLDWAAALQPPLTA